jgi:hypothetical protein
MGKEKTSGKAMMVVIGAALVVLGALFLLNGVVPVLSIANLWPLFMLIPVVFFIPALVEKGKEASGVLIPGTILVFLTVYFLVLNYTSWDYVSVTWPNFILAPALGLFLFWLFNREQKGILIPVGILTVLTVIFYGTTLKNNYATAACFIVLGVLILAGSFVKKKPKEQ